MSSDLQWPTGQVDDLHMGALADSGLPVAVLAPAAAGGCQSLAGRVVREGPEGIVLDFSEEADFLPGDEALLLAGSLGSRAAAPARVVATTGRLAVIALRAPWRPFDARESLRPGAVQVLVRSRLGNSRQPGRIVDADNGGLVVEVPRKPGGRDIDIDLVAGGYAACIPCRLARADVMDEAALLYLDYGSLFPPQRAFVRSLQQALWEVFGVPAAS